MLLGKLLSVLPTVRRPVGGEEAEITALITDSRKAIRGGLFICLRGPIEDGHAYAREAYVRGCRHFVCEYPPDLPEDAYLILVPDTAAALFALAGAFYAYPERGIVLLGITGTKGKTTTAMLIYRLLGAVGIPVGYIGSGGALYAGVAEETENTTPSALVLRRLLFDMRRHGVRVVVIEVSSQALYTGRTAGLVFPITVFTNLANDHIGPGEHPDVGHYRAAKARLFSDYGCRSMVVNMDDENAPYMVAESCARHIVTVSCHRTDTHVYATRMRTAGLLSTSFFMHHTAGDAFPLTLSLPGECNVNNALLALCTVREYLRLYEPGVDTDLRTLARPLPHMTVPGRFQPVPTMLPEVDFIIDYAHNGYSLSAAIAALRAYAPARLVCLFGSVGERTYSRRAELARAACAADFCIVTVDNPGSEPPADTMKEICEVLEEGGREYVAIPDRAEAIRYAVRHARRGDMVLLCGKGDEGYQLMGDCRVPFCEKEILLEAAAEWAATPVP